MGEVGIGTLYSYIILPYIFTLISGKDQFEFEIESKASNMRNPIKRGLKQSSLYILILIEALISFHVYLERDERAVEESS